MNLARSSVKLFMANTTSSGLQFLGIMFFARELGASQMGIFFLFQALLGMLAIPADFGLRGAVEKRISEGKTPGVFLSSAIGLKFIPITVIVLGILLFRPLVNGYLGADIAIYLAAAIVLQEAAKLSVAVLKGELRVGETAVLNVVREAIWVGLGAILVAYGFAAEAMVYSLLAGIGVMSIWGWHKSSITLRSPSTTHARSLFNYGRYNVISSIGGHFYSWMDVAIIGLFLTQAHVGAYETAWRMTAFTMLFSRAIAATLFPQVSQWDAADAKQEIEAVIHNAILPSMFFVIPAFFGVLVFSHEILGLIFGSEFTIAAGVLVILTGEKILQSVHIILGRSLQGIDRPDLAAWATVVSVGMNLVLNIVLIISFGIVGAAVATTLSFAANTLLHGYYLSRSVTIELPYSEIGWCFLSSAAMGLLLFVIKSRIPVITLPRLLLAILLGGVIYGVFILFFRPIRVKVVRNVGNIVAIGS